MNVLSTSRWNFTGGNQTLEASIAITAPRHTSISFQCSRFVEGINPSMQTIFANAIRGRAHADMTQNPYCSHDAVTGGCGNRRRHLSECRCEVLDRVTHPARRTHYEDRVIETILDLISSSMTSFHIKLAVFCSGELLGEQVLLFRLLDRLQKVGAAGTIELFFIDHCYREAIRNVNHTDFTASVGGEGAIPQFLKELCACLPTTITVKGSFFGDSADYIRRAEESPEYRHHLLIGADIEDANVDMGEIRAKAGLGVTEPIALIKTDTEAPLLCQVDDMGTLTNCYHPEPQTAPPTKKEKGFNSSLTIGLSILALLIIGALGVWAVSNSKRKSMRS